MKFFLDTASLSDIKKWASFGVVDGVTTNPTLLSKEGRDPLEQLSAITEIVSGPVSAQVTHTQHDQMMSQGLALSRIAPNILVKVPSTEEGFLAAKELLAEGVDCNVTLTFDPGQSIPFCLLPVAYVSLIIGRVEDYGLNSIELIRQIRETIDRLESTTRLICASIRNPHHLNAAVIAGSDVITVPPATWSNLYTHPLTISGQEDFLTAWRTLPSELRESYEQLAASPLDVPVEA